MAAAKADLIAGTITLTNGSSVFTGTGTSFALSLVGEGDEFKQIEGQTQWEAMVATIVDNTHGTLVRPWGGATGTYAYRLRFQADGQRVTAQARNLIELLGDGTLLSLAGLTGPGVIELLPGGGAQVVPKTDLVSGAAYDVQVANLAARTAYDGQTTGYAVLVANAGDGRAAIYSKNSNTSADWSAPSFVTGPVGPASTVPGIIWRGTYSGATAYVVNDGVKFNGSSFRNIVAGTGNAPSSANPPVDNTWWVVVAAKGTDGAGTGDVVGPASATNNGFARFDGTTGKLIKDSAARIANADLAQMVTARIKGRTTAGTGDPEDLTAAQVLVLLKAVGAYAKDNIVGSVSQSGGVPTGMIFETNSNANGTYVRFADGTQLCFALVSVASLTIAAAFQGGFRSAGQDWTYPAGFASAARVLANGDNVDAFSVTCADSTSRTTAATFVFTAVTSQGAATRTALLFAIGKWI